eukprot:scaffold858_cov123-Cylindrotheca_fusiformis.AAC.5
MERKDLHSCPSSIELSSYNHIVASRIIEQQSRQLELAIFCRRNGMEKEEMDVTWKKTETPSTSTIQENGITHAEAHAERSPQRLPSAKA